MAVAAGCLDREHADIGRQPSRSIFADDDFMTSNGRREMSDLITGSIGFAPAGERLAEDDLDQKIYRTASEAANSRPSS